VDWLSGRAGCPRNYGYSVSDDGTVAVLVSVGVDGRANTPDDIQEVVSIRPPSYRDSDALAAQALRKKVYATWNCAQMGTYVVHAERPTPISTPEASISAARQAWEVIFKHGLASDRMLGAFSPKETVRFEPYTATVEGDDWMVRGAVPPGFRGVTLVTAVRRGDGYVTIYPVETE
jgi:hypothetical protein